MYFALLHDVSEIWSLLLMFTSCGPGMDLHRCVLLIMASSNAGAAPGSPGAVPIPV
jgi:hypothetical protein